jgi:hypothetical protein
MIHQYAVKPPAKFTTLKVHHIQGSLHSRFTTLKVHHIQGSLHSRFTTLKVHHTQGSPHSRFTTINVHHNQCSPLQVFLEEQLGVQMGSGQVLSPLVHQPAKGTEDPLCLSKIIFLLCLLCVTLT